MWVGCGVVQIVVRRPAVRQACVRIPIRHPNRDISAEWNMNEWINKETEWYACATKPLDFISTVLYFIDHYLKELQYLKFQCSTRILLWATSFSLRICCLCGYLQKQSLKTNLQSQAVRSYKKILVSNSLFNYIECAGDLKCIK